MGKPEAFVEKYLLDQCERHGLYCLKVVCESRNGFPDRFITGPNGPILVETKSPVGVLRKEQKQFIEDLRERHVDVRTAYTRDQVDALLEELTGEPCRPARRRNTSPSLDRPKKKREAEGPIVTLKLKE